MTSKLPFTINDLTLASYCPLTISTYDKERYVPFFKLLDTFDNNENTYIKDYKSYFPFILKTILYNSIEVGKSIETYESYFFNVCHGYNRENDLELSMALISRYWSSFIIACSPLISLTNKPSNLYTITKFPLIRTSTRFINCTPVNVPLSLDVMLKMSSMEEPDHYFIVIPSIDNKPLITNNLVNRLINLYPNSTISILSFSMESSTISFDTLSNTQSQLKHINNYLENSYIDFKQVNFSKCNICPVKNSCTISNKFNTKTATSNGQNRAIRFSVNIK